MVIGFLPMGKLVRARRSAHSSPIHSAKAYCSALTVLFALLTLAGCQGVSAGGSASQQQSPPATGTLGLSGSSLSFGAVAVGAGKTLTLTAKNTGEASLTITAGQSNSSQFAVSKPALPLAIAAGSSATLSVTFTPKATGSSSGTIAFSSDASDTSVNLQVSGDGVEDGTLSPNPASLSFGSVQLGSNLSLYETLTNVGGSSVDLTQDSVTGTGFSVIGLTLPQTLTPGGSVTFSVVFAPQSAGSVSGSLTVDSDASNPSLTIPLSGDGAASGQLSLIPNSLNFGNVIVGNSSPLQASLKATGTNVTVSAPISSSSEYAVSGPTFPLTIQAGNSVTFTVTFTPQSTGQANATITFNSNASDSPTVLSLTGDGTNPTPHSVALSWNENSQDIIGYNVYRGTQHGGPYSQINTTLDSNTSYKDGSVTNGDTYYYVTTAVNSDEQESSYSNEAEAQIPND
jgi:hypothetical protein